MKAEPGFDWFTLLNPIRTRVVEVFLFDGGFGIRLDARDLLGTGHKKK